MMKKIAIIGAGQLGSRHLQGLKNTDVEMDIFVVDTNQSNLDISKKRYEEISDNNNSRVNSVSYVNDISFLPQMLDLVIIATSSKPRAEIIKTLLIYSKVKFLILEKVLFPALHEYQEIEELLKIKQVKTWVNCPRRLFEHYKMLTTMISTPIQFSVIGKNWGLGCNAIHFLDLFSMLSGEQEFLLDTRLLDNEIYPSKRDGYIEFTGTIEGTTPSGSVFSISSLKEYEAPTTISIKYKAMDLVIIDEANNSMFVNGEKMIIQSPFQSQLTGKIVDRTLLHGESDLTNFQESIKIHQQFLSPLIDFYNNLTGGNNDICPIT